MAGSPVSRSNNPNIVLNPDTAGRGSGQRNRAQEAVFHFPAAAEKLGMGMLLALTRKRIGERAGGAGLPSGALAAGGAR